MAVTANVKSVGLKIVSNYGEQNGKIVKRSKTYGDVKSDATNESIYNTYKLIKTCRSPSANPAPKPLPKSSWMSRKDRGGKEKWQMFQKIYS